MIFQDLNLNAPLLNALADLEYEYPTPIQEKAFPIIMSGKSLIGIAQTGTGKTFAYLLPLLRQMTFSKQKEPRILIVAPTRELVIQILNEVKKLTKYSSIRSLAVYGGTNINTQKQLAYDGTDILVATPGRLVDLAYTGVLRLKSVQKLVIDEVDEMLSLGFRSQLVNVLELVPQQRQNLMFSATLTPDVEEFINVSLPITEKIEIVPHGTPIDKITQWGYHVPNFNTKVNLLETLINEDSDFSKVLVFVSSKKLADRLFKIVDKLFPDQFCIIHSNKSHNNRLNTLKEFTEGTHKFLIATDIIARGMDISDVSHVINFDMPETPEDYIHRIGRTGRADNDGIAISFINGIEETHQRIIEDFMKKEITIVSLPEDLIISNIYGEDEMPTTTFEKNYLKSVTSKAPVGAFHEKKGKNKKVNFGSPKITKAKFDKNGKRIKKKFKQ